MTDFKLPEGYGAPRAGKDRRSAAPGRWLRTLTGVDENLLASVWEERSKYTALGGVMLGTALIAAFSMWHFAGAVMGRMSLVALVPAVTWMLFVLTLDRWLVAPQANGGRSLTALLSRLLVALLLGVVVAEPLVLRVFETAIEERIANERSSEVDELRGNLLRCNPDPSMGTDSRPEDCRTEHILSFGAAPETQAAELAALREDAARLQERVDKDTTLLTALDKEVRGECRVLIRNAVTGLLERTSECHRLRGQADDYRSTHRTGENEERLAGMLERISEIETALADSRGDFLTTRNQLVTERIVELREQQQAMGMLERLRTLHELTADDGTLQVAVWLVRLLFVVIDALPVLIKFTGGQSSYDRMLTAKVGSAVKLRDLMLRKAEERAQEEYEKERTDAEQRLRRHQAEAEAAWREHVAAMSIRTRHAVNTLEEEMRRVPTA